MRIMIKGGVWKNTEDEILKAAVMKYGLNQWARISSLLVRKSAKQCKARWYEWLDPSIKKTEWTREEDEKLLHLAKLMPTQWRTIAPIVGRTPAQCLERYEKLLDAAAAKDDTYDPADDPRRLRPGEIDPNPEAKPARPDPIDMDEDEKEMLSEARARLANTRGKKAKRKAREKQLEEARRLASLQKKRELKAAGIEMRARDRRRRGVDYNQEVAFEKAPAIGFYDTAAEKETTKELGREFRPLTLEEMEGRRRKDIEANLAKKDAERDRIKERHDQPGAVAKDIELNDPAMVSRRRRMMLPAPQISEAELQAIARGDAAMDIDGDLTEGAGGEATRRLLGDYQTPGRAATPMRTPRSTAPGGADRITLEAQNLARLQAGQTPLMGGANPELHPSDFAGVTPRNTTAATPHPMATPQIGASPFPGATPGATPGGGRSVAGISATAMRTPLLGGRQGPGATPMRTPLRDELGLNDPGATPGGIGSLREERAREKAARAELREGLLGLPAPQNEYQIVVPENEAEAMEEDGPGLEEDAAKADARRKAAAKAAEEAELRKRSQVVQRGLPRPLAAPPVPEPAAEEQKGGISRQAVERLIAAEVAALLAHEALIDPLPSKDKREKKDRKRRRGAAAVDEGWEEVSPEDMTAAAELLAEEMQVIKAAMQVQEVDQEEFSETWETSFRDFIYHPDKAVWGRKAGATNSDRLNSLQAEFKGLKEEMLKEAQRGAKLEAKVGIVIKGHQDRHSKLDARLQTLCQQARSSATELACFRALQQQEDAALPRRRAALQAEVAEQQQREADLQEKYKALNDELQDLSTSAMIA